MKKYLEAKKQAEKDIRKALKEEGKSFINVSLKALTAISILAMECGEI